MLEKKRKELSASLPLKGKEGRLKPKKKHPQKKKGKGNTGKGGAGRNEGGDHAIIEGKRPPSNIRKSWGKKKEPKCPLSSRGGGEERERAFQHLLSNFLKGEEEEELLFTREKKSPL